MDSGSIFIFFIFILIIIVGNYLIIKNGQDKIIDDAEMNGLTIRKISWAPFHFSFGGRGRTFYNVEYLDQTGVSHRTTCETGLLRRVRWHV
jgi:hypothetical protein